MIKTITISLAVIATMTVAYAQDGKTTRRPAIGDHAHTIADVYACRDFHDWKRITLLLADRDKEAADRYLYQKRAIGACELLSEGTSVTVEDSSILNDSFYSDDQSDADFATTVLNPAVCVRPQGEPDCVWMTEQGVVTLCTTIPPSSGPFSGECL